MTIALAIGLDIGGTKLAAAVVDASGALRDPRRRDTPRTNSWETLRATVSDLCAEHQGIVAVGVGAAGLVEWPSGHIRWAPNNPYHDLPLRALLEEATGLPAVVDNDANAATWSEWRYGAGRGVDHMLMVALGTGLGSGAIVGGQLLRGASGLALELGHVPVQLDGPMCTCGHRGCIEALASGWALRRDTQAALEAEGQPGAWTPDVPTQSDVREDLEAAVAATGGTGEALAHALAHGDPVAGALVAQLGKRLGAGIAAAVTLLDPQLVVLGGGLAALGEPLIAAAERGLADHVFAASHRIIPPIRPAHLGAWSGVVGAGLLALDAATGPSRSR